MQKPAVSEKSTGPNEKSPARKSNTKINRSKYYIISKKLPVRRAGGLREYFCLISCCLINRILNVEYRMYFNQQTRHDDAWLPKHSNVVTTLLKIWVSDTFQDRHRKIVSGICGYKVQLHTHNEFDKFLNTW